MNYSPLFSIMIANHNDGEYLREALASVEKQTYKNYEVVIVDDGSEDDSKKILEELKNKPNYRIYYNDKNHGCGYTKRKCVELAKGEICGFLDADDALTLDALEIMVKEHLQHPEISLIYSRYHFCDKTLKPQYTSRHQCKIPSGSSFLEYRRGAISHFVTFKKEFYLKTTGINDKFRISEDLDLYFKLEEVGKTLFVDKPLYYYRCGTGNNTSLNDNVVIAAYWEIIAKTEACRRRKLSYEIIELPMIEEIINSIVSLKTTQIKNTREYKIGNYLLHPKLIVKRLFRL